MPFTVPEDLAPECYPLAWLLGSWRGFGLLGYPGVPEQSFVQELRFDHDGGPYLRATGTIWLATATEPVSRELTGAQGAALLQTGQQWATETSYWRPVGGGSTADGGPDGHGGTGSPPATELEVLVADPAGHLSVYVGSVRGPRIDLSTDAVVRTSTAAEVTGATRVYGLVQRDLMWAMDLAAFGQELQTYASGRLTRTEGGDGS